MTPPTSRQLHAGTLVALGIGVAVVSLLGPLGTGLISYHVAADVENQVIGGDAAALFLVAPVSATAGVLLWRGHRAGAALSLAPTAFAMYLYTQLALGGDFASRPGNSERFFLLFLSVFLLGAAGFILSWRAVGVATLPDPTPALRRAVVTVLFLIALFLAAGLHLRGLVDVLGGPPYDVAYTQSPAVFWVVKWMDLGIVAPVVLLTGVGLLQRAPWAPRLMYAVLGWGALLGSAVAAMGIVMVLNDDPAGDAVTATVFTAFALAFLGLTGRIFTPLVTGTDGSAAGGSDEP